ncbi:hypothetical protein [Massilibacteroides vaginae]|nr:hypothetical protein [Massilibacteroides vaginae]
MRCFDKLSMTLGWYEMLWQAQHDNGWERVLRGVLFSAFEFW